MVRCGEEDKCASALAVLRDLAATPEHCNAMVQYGGIPTFVDILSSGLPMQACIHAASCLRSLALQEQWALQARLFNY